MSSQISAAQRPGTAAALSVGLPLKAAERAGGRSGCHRRRGRNRRNRRGRRRRGRHFGLELKLTRFNGCRCLGCGATGAGTGGEATGDGADPGAAGAAAGADALKRIFGGADPASVAGGTTTGAGAGVAAVSGGAGDAAGVTAPGSAARRGLKRILGAARRVSRRCLGDGTGRRGRGGRGRRDRGCRRGGRTLRFGWPQPGLQPQGGRRWSLLVTHVGRAKRFFSSRETKRAGVQRIFNRS